MVIYYYFKSCIFEFFEERRIKQKFYSIPTPTTNVSESADSSFSSETDSITSTTTTTATSASTSTTFSSSLFGAVDKALDSLDDPFLISKRYLQKLREENIFQYGETPITTIDKIAKALKFQKGDVVLELGCGRGRTAIFLSSIWKCKVYGVEKIQKFVEDATNLSNKYQLDAKFFWEDFLQVSFWKKWEKLVAHKAQGTTWIYLYGSMLTDENIKRLCDLLPSSCSIITISYPLSIYSKKFTLVETIKVAFPWGKTEAFVSKKNTCYK